MAFTRNNKKLLSVILTIYVILIAAFYGILYSVKFRNLKSRSVTVSYRPMEMKNKYFGEEKCIEFINSHYSNSELTLEKISEETAISPRRVTKIIHDKYNCNFKTYLNRIRINESMRFLTQSELNIGEIAFKVGFNNQSHFNRVFKSEMNMSPSEYRDRNQT